jgi:deoxyribonuclease V
MRWPKSNAPTPRAAAELQRAWARRVVLHGDLTRISTIAGVDVGVRDETASAAVCVFSFPALELLESATATRAVEFPYVPGLLGFREVPCIVEAFAKLALAPDLLLVDGHGLAHPRRFGVATHLGFALDRPSIGCAKSVLVGEYREPAQSRGASTRLMLDGEIIGRALRTRVGVKPVFVSIGHRVDLASAVRTVLRCTRGLRLPEPIRAAHNLAALSGGVAS